MWPGKPAGQGPWRTVEMRHQETVGGFAAVVPGSPEGCTRRRWLDGPKVGIWPDKLSGKLVRQGKRGWHSGRDGDEVKAEGLRGKKLQVSGY